MHFGKYQVGIKYYIISPRSLLKTHLYLILKAEEFLSLFVSTRKSQEMLDRIEFVEEG